MPARWREASKNEGFHRYFLNTGWLLAGQVFALFISFFTGILVARRLGPEYYGVLNYALSFTAIFGVFFCSSMDAALTRELVKYPEREKELLGTFGLIKLGGGLLTLVLSSLFAVVGHFDRLTLELVLILSGSYIIQSGAIISLLFQARVKAINISRAQILANSLSSILKVVWFMAGGGLVILAAIYVWDAIFNTCFLIYYYHRGGQKISQWRLNWSAGWGILKSAWPLMFSGLAMFGILKIDQVIIGQLINKTAVGFYAVADKITEIWNFIPTLICLSLFPAIINARKTDQKIYRVRLRRLYGLMFFSSLIILAAVWLFARPLIISLFGARYEMSILILRIYVLSLPGLFLFAAANQYLLAEHREKRIFLANASGLTMNIVLNFILIPHFGLIGAAWSTVITFVFLPFFMIFPGRRKNKIDASADLRDFNSSSLIPPN